MLWFDISGTSGVKSSVVFRVLKLVFSIYFLITVTLTGMHLLAEYHDEKQSLLRQLKLFGQTFSPALADALWNLDDELLQAASKGLLQNPNIIGFKMVPENIDIDTPFSEGVFIDSDGRKQYFKSAYSSQEYLESKLIYYTFEVSASHLDGTSDNALLGKATLYSSQLIVWQQIKNSFFLIIINAFVKTIALWYLFIWIGWKYLSRPLGEFTDKVQSLSLDKLENINVINERQDANELAKLEHTFNAMIENLRKTAQDKHKATRALEISERYLQSLFDSMPSILISLDANMNIVHWNKAAQDLYQQQLGHTNKGPIRALNFMKPHLDMIDASLKEREMKKISKIHVVINNVERYLSIIVFPLDAIIGGVVLYIEDISERISMENLMIQTEKMTSLGTLAAGMAHEINNPLGGIIQGIGNINRRLSPDLKKNVEVAEACQLDLAAMQAYCEQREITVFLDGMKRLCDRAAGIVKNVLKFSRRGESEMVLANVNNIVDETITIISTDYDIKKHMKFQDLKITRHLDANIPEIMCSPSEISQVLLNLLKNAAHAVSDNDRSADSEIKVKTTIGEGCVIIDVIDNGCGIKAHVLKHLFEPFFTTKAVGVGTGLGLSISYYIIVDKHRGKLYVDSVEGVGTTFTIELPITQDSLTESE